MDASIVRIGLLVLVLPHLTTIADAQSNQPEEPRLRSEVARLASPQFGGRRGEGGIKTAAHLISEFRRLGLEPLFNGQFTQPVPERETGRSLGRNVGARLLGSDPKLRDEWVIISAHYDHLGVRDGVLYPGADDNASGVAMMLEVARVFSQSAERPKRSLMFVAFDLEELGLFGSRYFVEHSPVPLDRVGLFITADMIGRALGGVCDPYVFVVGSENAPGLRPWIDRASKDKPVTVGLLGADLMMIDRSDYGPFRSRHVPYLFFSTGENPTYHTPQDVAETIDYRKLEAISRLVCDITRQAVDAAEMPRWSVSPDHPLAEAVTVRDLLRALLAQREQLKIGGPQALLMTNALRRLDAIVARGSITPGERAGMLTIARLVIVSVL